MFNLEKVKVMPFLKKAKIIEYKEIERDKT